MSAVQPRVSPHTHARLARIATLLLLLSAATRAHAEPVLRIVAVAPSGATVTAHAVQARVGEEVVLSLELRDGGRALPLPDGTRVVWLRVEPRMFHVALPPANPGRQTYSNSVLFGPHHGDWLGFDTIEYDERPLEAGAEVSFDGARVRLRGARTADPQRDALGAAGSMWLAAEARLPDGRKLHTAGARDVDRLGLSPSVQRVSFREGDDFIGWLSTYEHVPDVFGSSGGRGATHQSDRYVGADCMDLMTGAARAMGRTDLAHASVSALPTLAAPVSDVLAIGEDAVVRDERGVPVVLRWGVDVQRGDLIALDYGDDPENSLPRAWDHVGALVGDAAEGARGVFDASDAYRNMTGRGVRDVALGRELPLRVRIWRWKPARGAHRRAAPVAQ